MASLGPPLASIRRLASTAGHGAATAGTASRRQPSDGGGPGPPGTVAGGAGGGGGGGPGWLVGVGERERRPVQHLGRAGGAEELDEAGHGAGPARLVAGPYPRPVIAVEVLVEQQQVAPVRVVLEGGHPAVDGPRPAASRRKIEMRRSEISLATW